MAIVTTHCATGTGSTRRSPRTPGVYMAATCRSSAVIVPKKRMTGRASRTGRKIKPPFESGNRRYGNCLPWSKKT